MSNLVLGVAAAVVLGPAGFALTTAATGFLIGSTVGSLLFPPKLPDGPRLSDLSVQSSTYGKMIAEGYGLQRYSGNVIWSTPLNEHPHEEGKGGGSQTTYSYTISCAISICKGPIVGVRRIWADGHLIFDASVANTGMQSTTGGGVISVGANSITGPGWVLYLGTETQLQDPTIQANQGDTPAYRGQAYIVFTDFDLTGFRTPIPDFSFEVVGSGTYAVPAPVVIGSGTERGAMDPNTGYLWALKIDTPSSGQTTIYVSDPVSKTVLRSIVIDIPATQIAYNAVTGEFWAALANPALLYNDIAVLSASGMSLIRYIEWSGSAVRWPGAIVYNSTARMVYIASINGVNSDAWYFQPDGTFVGSIAGHTAGWTTQFIDMPEIRSVALLGYDSKVEIIDADYHYVKASYASAFSSGSDQRIAWDPVRGKIMWIKGDVSSYCYVIDIAAGTVTQTTMSPAPASNMNALIYHAGIDRYIGMAGTSMVIINPTTFGVEKTIAQGVGVNWLFEDAALSDRVYAISSDNVARCFFLSDRLTPSSVPLSTVVTSESAKVGLSAGDIDVTALTDSVTGYTITRQGTGRSRIEQLMMGYIFDSIESDDKIKFVKRGSKSIVTIADDDLAAHSYGQETPSAIELVRTQEIDLPDTVNIKYINPSADHQISAQYARRLIGSSGRETTTELPIALTDAQAKGIADQALYSAWASRTGTKFTTGMKYAKYEPTDLMTVSGNVVRISKKSINGNIIHWEGSYDSNTIYSSGAIAPPAPSVAQTIPMRSKTAVELMDIPLLRDQDNDAGFYWAASGYPGRTWDGCVLFKSTDNGASWAEVETITTAATIGTATTALGDFSQNVFDESSTVTVALNSGTLSSISELAVLNGGNAALVGSEIIQFRTATLNGDGTYTLSGLLRGRKGTRTSGHAAGDRFVLLNTTSVRRVDMATAEIGLPRLYKAVTIGDSLASASEKSFTNTAIGLECLSPVLLGGGRNAAGDLTINWVRRTRIGGEWRDYVDAALGETTESYEVEVWTSGYTTLKRTITSSTPTASYTSAQQVTDFGSNQATVYLRVYQLSATVGRGFVLQGSV